MNQTGNKAQPQRRAPKLAGSDIKVSDNDLVYEPDDDDADDNDDIASSLMECVCLYEGGVVRFDIEGRRWKMRAGEIIKLPATYCTPIQHRPTGDPTPSVIQCLTGSKVLPVVDPRVQKDPVSGLPVITVKVRAAKEAKDRKASVQQAGV